MLNNEFTNFGSAREIERNVLYGRSAWSMTNDNFLEKTFPCAQWYWRNDRYKQMRVKEKGRHARKSRPNLVDIHTEPNMGQ